jgi:hypothetical protein
MWEGEQGRAVDDSKDAKIKRALPTAGSKESPSARKFNATGSGEFHCGARGFFEFLSAGSLVDGTQRS